MKPHLQEMLPALLVGSVCREAKEWVIPGGCLLTLTPSPVTGEHVRKHLAGLSNVLKAVIL